MVDEGRKAIFYGGTFDPPHKGHEGCIRLARQHDPTAHIFVVPAFVPPAGAGQIKQPQASFAHRLNMCRLAFQTAQPDIVHISDIEAHLPSPSYTFQTLEALSRTTDFESWSLLIGGDQLDNLSKWYRVKDLVCMVDLLVVNRSSSIGQVKLDQRLQKLADDIQYPIEKIAEDVFQWGKLSGRKIFLLTEEPVPAASSILRQKDFSSQLARAWTSEEVREYIAKNNLYQ